MLYYLQVTGQKLLMVGLKLIVIVNSVILKHKQLTVSRRREKIT